MQASIHLLRQVNLVHVVWYQLQKNEIHVIQLLNINTQIQQMTVLFINLPILSTCLNVFFLNINVFTDMLKTKHKLKYSVEQDSISEMCWYR